MSFTRDPKSQSDEPADRPHGRKARRAQRRDTKQLIRLLNPHGNGTLRQSDPLLDTLTGGKAVTAKRRPGGTWEVEILPDPDDEK